MLSDCLIVIPARIGSKRLPGKPLRKLLGKTLIEWVFEAAKKVTDNVVVATDSDDVVSVVKKAGGEAVITSSFHQSGTDRVAEAVRLIGQEFEYVVNIQGDEPFVEEEHLFPVVKRLKEGDRFSTIAAKFSSFEDVENPANVKVVLDRDGYAIYFSRSIIPFDRDGFLSADNYLKHIGIYGFRKDALFEFVSWNVGFLERVEKLEQLRILEHGEKIAVSVVEKFGIGVDTEEDLKKAEKLLRERLNGC
ncbi:3-deoxy-manno-octulosonate cytidylyltransferase [Desulfurobacterium atlanticum]|uniref:3-deoxy-manno-octulosonate cytidylyltransferase n=1 Tax=Desulfurobacterium atlanticum TaxID=240169 RepID=A0A238Z4U2_9BACT|nr:3-deoxy-manno-octulosonate cytidylyltransferase [Desulfurobacterium atlanticum]SNR78455.1 3-deoxy-manno-octulosonate cytidylyltransferase (CMP-KDO synthetase) [Desulfurobacterium atlanticum]